MSYYQQPQRKFDSIVFAKLVALSSIFATLSFLSVFGWWKLDISASEIASQGSEWELTVEQKTQVERLRGGSAASGLGVFAFAFLSSIVGEKAYKEWKRPRE